MKMNRIPGLVAYVSVKKSRRVLITYRLTFHSDTTTYYLKVRETAAMRHVDVNSNLINGIALISTSKSTRNLLLHPTKVVRIISTTRHTHKLASLVHMNELYKECTDIKPQRAYHIIPVPLLMQALKNKYE